MPAAPQIAAEAEAFAASLPAKTAEMGTALARLRAGFHLGEAVAAGIAVLMGFYGMVFVGNVLLTY
jgi:hypothetical protein